MGFDIILREDAEPFLLEVNHSPSFHTPSVVDVSVKIPLLRDTLALLNVQPRHRRELSRRASERVQCRLYGDTFDSTHRTKMLDDDEDENEERIMPPTDDLSCHAYFASLTADRAWTTHLQAEEQNLGGFDLVYPTDVYESQPTRGLQSVYDRLRHASQLAYETTLNY